MVAFVAVSCGGGSGSPGALPAAPPPAVTASTEDRAASSTSAGNTSTPAAGATPSATVSPPTTATPPTTTAPPTTAPPTTAPPTAAPPTTAAAPVATSVAPTTPLSGTTIPIGSAGGLDGPTGLALPATEAAFERLAETNAVASLTVVRDGITVLRRATGRTVAGGLVTPDSPMVVASVSKLFTALGIARLVQEDRLELSAPIPWTELGVTPHPAWNDVTGRELLDHTSGMPVARRSWLDRPGSCAEPLQDAVASPPRAERGTWVYSNGNYCALGMLIEHVTGAPLDAAIRALVLDPAGISGPHLTTDGTRPDDAPYAGDLGRFDRLGGAGTWMASTDDLAALLVAVTEADRATLVWPGVIIDQYGWGHTGTVTGAKACAWLMEEGRTLVAAVVAGNSPSTGGRVCDAVLQGVAADFGFWNGEPIRSPD